MNVGLEFHDSHVRAVEYSGRNGRLSFEPAYLHHSVGRPGLDAGTGHVQPAEMLLYEAEFIGLSPQCAGPLSAGTLSVDGVAYSILPVPFHATGAVVATFIFRTGAVLKATAKSVSCTVQGSSSLVETYAA
jgi:hypothetical protein